MYACELIDHRLQLCISTAVEISSVLLQCHGALQDTWCVQQYSSRDDTLCWQHHQVATDSIIDNKSPEGAISHLQLHAP